MDYRKFKHLICHYDAILEYINENFLRTDILITLGNNSHINLETSIKLIGAYYQNEKSYYGKKLSQFDVGNFDGRLILVSPYAQFTLYAKNLRLEHSKDNKNCILRSSSLDDFCFLLLEKE